MQPGRSAAAESGGDALAAGPRAGRSSRPGSGPRVHFPAVRLPRSACRRATLRPDLPRRSVRGRAEPTRRAPSRSTPRPSPLRGPGCGIDPPHLDIAQRLRASSALVVENRFVEHGRGHPGRQLGELPPVLLEGVVGGDAVLVADDAPGAHPRRIPGHLGAGLVGEGRRESDPVLAAERLTSLCGVVEVAVPAVSVLGQLLEQVVVVVGDPHSHGDEPQRVAGDSRACAGATLSESDSTD